MLLAGDVGGTKVRLALFEPNKKTLICRREKHYLSRKYDDLFTLIQEFLTEEQSSVSSLCVGVAGPVVNGRCHETNIPWIIDAHVLQQQLSLSKVWVINDLEAHAWGISMLDEKEILCLHEGVKVKGNQALISAGTGLGEAGLYWDGRRHHPFACEGGHVDFAPLDEEQLALWHFLKKQFDHISYERILCGDGLYRLYRFLVDTGREKKDVDIEALLPSSEPQKRITEKAMSHASRACVHAVELFVSIYGAEAGNLALKFLSVGGVYIGGGIAPHLSAFFAKNSFPSVFSAKGRFSTMLEKIPLHIILNDRTALLGAARYAQERE
jgi:glucokinase